MTGVTCEAGNAYYSGAPDFTLLRVHVVPLFIPYLVNVRTYDLLDCDLWI